MMAPRPLVRLLPEEKDDEVVVSRKKLDRLLAEKEAEIERLRRENAELRRRLQVHENPNVPPSVRNHSPGYARARPLVPSGERKKPGPEPGHEGVIREPLTPDQKVALHTSRCGRCHGERLRFRGTVKGAGRLASFGAEELATSSRRPPPQPGPALQAGRSQSIPRTLQSLQCGLPLGRDSACLGGRAPDPGGGPGDIQGRAKRHAPVQQPSPPVRPLCLDPRRRSSSPRDGRSRIPANGCSQSCDEGRREAVTQSARQRSRTSGSVGHSIPDGSFRAEPVRAGPEGRGRTTSGMVG